ncbi:hypothetical protein [Streptomyces sp. NPDC002671]
MPRRSLTCAASTITAALLLTPAASVAAQTTDSGPSARDLEKEARANLVRADSVHLSLRDNSANVRGNRTEPTVVDLTLNRQGNCVGKVTMSGGGGSVELIKQGDQVWMKPDTAFYKAQLPGGQGGAVANLFRDRYIHGSTHDPLLRNMADSCDLTNFQKEVAGHRLGSPTKGSETTVNGTKAIAVSGTSMGKNVVMYVSSTTPHRLVEATRKGGGTDQTLTLDKYNAPVPSATPSARESVDISKLEQQLQNS